MRFNPSFSVLSLRTSRSGALLMGFLLLVGILPAKAEYLEGFVAQYQALQKRERFQTLGLERSTFSRHGGSLE